jgi:hypothetical protein
MPVTAFTAIASLQRVNFPYTATAVAGKRHSCLFGILPKSLLKDSGPVVVYFLGWKFLIGSQFREFRTNEPSYRR